MKELKADICVVGAGSAGLSVAAVATRLGARTVLIESGTMGGDCLNVGCVPSKALLAAAHRAAAYRSFSGFGLTGQAPNLDPVALRGHIQSVIAGIAPMDSVERFEGLGVTVIKEHARFLDPETLGAGEHRIRARRFVLAVGSRPFVPPIPGLDGVEYLTNETIFAKAGDIRDLIVIGGGPIGVEMAQAHARLGAKVSVVEMASLLPRDDPDAVGALRAQLGRDGIAIHEGASAKSISRGPGGLMLEIQRNDGSRSILQSEHLLIAAGRRPDFANLGLEDAGINTTPQGISVDEGLRTSNRKVFAIGDCTGHPAFTHVGSYHAGIVIRRALFRLPAKVDYRALPWVTFTEPELAQVGLIEPAARSAHGSAIDVIRLGFEDNDRARTERETDGFIKVIVNRRGKILGVTVLGANAGELLAPWCLAMAQGHGLSAMGGLVLAYPTRAELSKRAALQYLAPRLFSWPSRALVGFLRCFG